jgi:hypothetical protein
MNLIDTPISISHHLRGRISITIGKIAAGGRLDKAHPCHLNGTEVIAREAAKAAIDSRVLTARLKPRPFKTIALSKHFKLSHDPSMSFGIFRFSGLAWGWNYDGGEIAFCSQFPEGRQITELQIIPAAE